MFITDESGGKKHNMYRAISQPSVSNWMRLLRVRVQKSFGTFTHSQHLVLGRNVRFSTPISRAVMFP